MYYTRGTLSNNHFFLLLSTLCIFKASVHLFLAFPSFSRGAVTLPSVGEERGGAAGAPHSGQRATVALSVLLVWPEQQSH